MQLAFILFKVVQVSSEWILADAVGDAYQSIHSFRSTSFGFCLPFKKQLARRMWRTRLLCSDITFRAFRK